MLHVFDFITWRYSLVTENDRPFSQSTFGILAILNDGAKSGYEIMKFLTSPEVFYWRESYGNIYPILKKLNTGGFVRQINADVKKKRRIYYEITDKGRSKLSGWLTTPPILSRFRVEMLMKLRFGEIAGIDNMKTNIEHYKKLNEAEIEECRALIETMEEGDNSLTNSLRELTVLYFLHFKQAMNDWCTESLSILDKHIEESSDN